MQNEVVGRRDDWKRRRGEGYEMEMTRFVFGYP